MAFDGPFPQQQESAIATFDYADLASGLGYDILYGTASKNFAGTASYHLVTDASAKASAAVSALSSATKATYHFLGSSFNEPRTAKGTAYVSLGMGANNATAHVAVQIFVLDSDLNATAICTLTSSSIITVGATDLSEMKFIPLALTETNIKIGESLRLSVTHQQTSTGNTEVGHDPTGEDGTYIPLAGTAHTTKMQLLMPFKIDN